MAEEVHGRPDTKTLLRLEFLFRAVECFPDSEQFGFVLLMMWSFLCRGSSREKGGGGRDISSFGLRIARHVDAN